MPKANYSGRCNDCPLQSEGPAVPGEGVGEKVIIIGMCPGKDEKRKGRPFVGRSGDVLRGALLGYGYMPEEILITNVVMCHPPYNREPTKKEIKQCLPHLVEEINKRPKARILAMGNLPMRAFTDLKGGVRSQRGTWTTTNGVVDPQREVLVTYHPASIIRVDGDQWFNRWAMDVERIYEGKLPFIETEHFMLDTPQAVYDYFENLPDGVILSWDLETSAYRYYEGHILAMSLSHEIYKGWVITEEVVNDEAVKRFLVERFGDASINWVGHGAKFDWIFTTHYMGGYPTPWADTMLMHLALEENTNTHDLKVLARDYCGAPDWEKIIKSYLEKPKTDSYSLIPKPVLYRYAAYDADYTLRLYHIFTEMCEEDKTRSLHDRLLIPAAETTMFAEYGGVAVDIDDIDAWQVDLEVRIEEQEEELDSTIQKTVRDAINVRMDELGVPPTLQDYFWSLKFPKNFKITWDKTKNKYICKDPRGKDLCNDMKLDWGVLEPILCWRIKLIDRGFSAGSWQKVGTLVYDILGGKYVSGRDLRIARSIAQEYSTSAGSLQPFAAEFDEVSMILGLRSTKKLKSTYVDGLHPDANGRVHPKWVLHATVTGRLGCREPNLMNIPHEAGVRDFFIAAPGYVLVEADYSQAELRLLAAYASQLVSREEAEKSFLVKAFRAGSDLHTEAAIMLFGDSWDADGKGYENRMIAKAFNFGLVYGRSVESIARAFDITTKAAAKMYESFFVRMPDVKEYLKRLEAAVDDPGELITVYGRKRRFTYVDSWNYGEHKREARNFMMQSTASDMTLDATIRTDQWLRKEVGYGRLLIFLHDSAMFEVPECWMHETAKHLYSQLMDIPGEFFGDIVPFKVDVKVGYGWSSMYDYDIETGKVDYGREQVLY